MSRLIPTRCQQHFVLTDLVKQLVALVKDEDFQVLHGHMATLCQGEDSARGTNHNVGGVETLQELDLGIHRLTTVDDISAQVFHKLGEAVDFLLDLVG